MRIRNHVKAVALRDWLQSTRMLPLRIRIATVSLALTGLALSACGAPAPATAPNAAPNAAPVQQATPTPPPLPTRAVAARNTVAADGVLSPRSAPIAYAAEVSAKVTAVNVEPGQTVKRGEALATLDDTSLRDALADAELQLKQTEADIAQATDAAAQPAEIESARAALAAAQAQYEVTRRGPTANEIERARLAWESARDGYLAAQVNRDVYCDLDKEGVACQQQEASYGSSYESEITARQRYEELLKPVTQDKLTQAYAGVASAQARLDQLEAGLSPEQNDVNAARLNNAKSNVKRAQDNLRESVVLSPCDCVVQEVNVSVGAVPKGVAFTLVSLDGMQFKTTNLSERELTNIRVGNPATVLLRAFDDPFTGKVAAIVPQSTGAEGGAALFTVLIELDPSQALLLPGMTGQAEIEASLN